MAFAAHSVAVGTPKTARPQNVARPNNEMRWFSMGLAGTVRAMVALAVTTAFVGVAGGIVVVTPAQAATPASLTTLKAQAIYYQRKANEERRDFVVSAMASSSAWEAELWDGYLTTWSKINQSMTMNATVPDGLPAKGHVFVVLGSALTKSGGMSTKFKRRLKLAVKALEKYPKANVLVSGGAVRNGHTEAGVGREWLLDQDVAESRILVEKKSSSTIGNAKYSMALLAESGAYTSYSLITDSSHMRRASVLFEAAEVLVQENSGTPWAMRRLSNVAYPDMATAGKVPLSSSSIGYTASGVASVLGLASAYSDVIDSPPKTPVLTGLTVTAPDEVQYAVGDGPSTGDVELKAIYNKGVYTRIVTDEATMDGLSTDEVGDGTVTATYREGDVVTSIAFPYTVVKAASTLGVDLSTKTPRQAKTRVKAKVAVTGANGAAVATGRVRFYLDGKLIGSTLLQAGKPGMGAFTYPKIAKKGSHAVVVKYAGDERFKPVRKAVTITVS